MEKYCANHPFSEAHWYCKKCQTSYCFPCVEKKDFKFTREEACVHICPTCKRMVEWTGIQHVSDHVLISTAKALFFPFAPFALIVVVGLYLAGMLFSDNLSVLKHCSRNHFSTFRDSYKALKVNLPDMHGLPTVDNRGREQFSKTLHH